MPITRSSPGQTVELTSIQQYARNLQLQQAGFTETQIQQLGGGPSRFAIQAGQSYISMVRWDARPFVQDDWRVRPNLTVEPGLALRGSKPGERLSRLSPRASASPGLPAAPRTGGKRR